MVDMYVTAINFGWLEFDKDVPEHWKAQVATKLGIAYPQIEEVIVEEAPAEM